MSVVVDNSRGGGCYARPMSERSTGPTSPQPVEAGHAEESQPIEVGDRPFALTDSDDSEERDATRTPRSRTKTVVLSALLMAGLAGGAVLGAGAWRISAQK